MSTLSQAFQTKSVELVCNNHSTAAGVSQRSNLSQVSEKCRNTTDGSRDAATHGQPPFGIANRSQQPASTQHRGCPYHDTILQTKSSQDKKLPADKLARFFTVHNAGEQPALFRRHDNGELSISRKCTCIDTVDVAFDIDESAAKHYHLSLDRNKLSGYQVGL